MADDIATLGLEIKAEGVQKATKELDRLEKQTRENEDAADDMGRSFSALDGIVSALSVGAMSVLIKSSIETADRLQKMSIRLGASTEALSEFQVVADRSGVSFEALSMGLQRMTRRISEAASTGQGEAVGALKELGLSAQALEQIPLDMQFEAIAGALSQVEGSADKTRLAMKLFDSEGVALLQTMKNGAEGIREMREEARLLGVTLDQDTADAFADLSDAFGRLDSVTDSLVRDIAEGITPALTVVTQVVSQGVLEFNDLGNAIGAFAAATKLALSGEFSAAKQVLELRKEQRAEVEKAIELIWQRKDAQDQLNQSESGGLTAGAGISAGGTELDAARARAIALLESKKMQLSQGLELGNSFRQQELDAAIQHNLDLQQIEADRINNALELEKRANSQRLSAASTLFGGLAALAGAHGEKHFQAQKNFGIAQAIIDTYVGANKAIAELGPIAGPIAAAGIITAGLARVQLIRNTKPGGSAGGDAGGASLSGGGVSVPGANVPNQNAQQQSTQIFVVGGGARSDEDILDTINSIYETLERTDAQLLPENGADINNIQRL